MPTAQREASAKQTDLITRLFNERDVGVGGRTEEEAFLWERAFDVATRSGKFIGIREASDVITWLFTLDKTQQARPARSAPREDRAADAGMKPRELVGKGVYRHDGDVYLVVESKGQKDTPEAERRRYAKKLVKAPARRTLDGKPAKFEWEIERGMIWDLSPEELVPLDDAEILAIMIDYGRCLTCGQVLKAEKTMNAVRDTGIMVGPDCRKNYGR